jgi:HNH endonuclease
MDTSANFAQGLPHVDGLDIHALSRLFDNTTNSYKYIFLLSLLDVLSRRFFDVSKSVTFEELVIEMLANSWYPYSFFKLSFGLQDMIPSELESLNLEVDKAGLKRDFTGKEYLRELIASKKPSDHLVKFVPFRINTAFFRAELKNLPDYQVNRTVVRLANSNFETRKPLLKYGEDNRSVFLHPEWADYFKSNYSIIRGWVSWEWLQYMQRCNPSIPAISNKLFPPQQRDSLKSQTDYWRLVLRNQSLKCIYSNKFILIEENLSLDHYLPWSFVTHNLLWNLVPTSREVNSSKSDNLPSDIYFDPFVSMQHRGLTISHENMTAKAWNKFIEPYIAGLRITDKADLLDLEKLHHAYESVILPQLNLAISHGFAPNWVYIL